MLWPLHADGMASVQALCSRRGAWSGGSGQGWADRGKRYSRAPSLAGNASPDAALVCGFGKWWTVDYYQWTVDASQ